MTTEIIDTIDTDRIVVNGTEFVRADAPEPFDPLDPQPGDKVITRTVTMTLTGEVIACSPTWIVLDTAAWIADSGRWATAIESGTLSEVEPMGHGVRVARAAIVDITPWGHALPTVQK